MRKTTCLQDQILAPSSKTRGAPSEIRGAVSSARANGGKPHVQLQITHLSIHHLRTKTTSLLNAGLVLSMYDSKIGYMGRLSIGKPFYIKHL